jgi:hypothetical protein
MRDILHAAGDRERQGQSLALDIDARFLLQDRSAVQFQLASAILEEAAGMRQEEVVSELLTLGLEAVLHGATGNELPVVDDAQLPREDHMEVTLNRDPRWEEGPGNGRLLN